ncbi:MAG: DEAD/DEAH box helicase family protein [Winogradskyella sp.]|uniref:DEAD/DEAH box helicase family protein n=1 Tax=Winogradskyella sp. TaxID=1883156 RepID=UPI0017C37334|nr:DEAD/DEAH box helicase family protein [Winogradskyella sp.]MBT8245374.1 DEAD/DEAH box helicase family protein [Winogradskyella sp.]NNK23623.1 DEAD/DEAH box helicase family protein [Winogradskyella sp.]
MQTNFNFIQNDFPDLYKEASEAEQYVYIAPKYAALQCRIVLELTVNWLYDNDPDYERPYDTTLAGLMYDNSFKFDVSSQLLQELTLVRKIGNDAAHGKSIKNRQALICLRSIFRLLSFLAIHYNEAYPEIPSFRESIIPQGAVDEKTKQELQDKSEAIGKLIAENKEKEEKAKQLQEENELLKRKVEEQEAQLKARKEARQTEVIFEEVVPPLTPEAETRLLYIDVLLQEAGWHNLKPKQDLEYKVTGMPTSVNPSGIGYVDYVLWDDNGKPLAVVEAKKSLADAKQGKHQAQLYANCLEAETGQRPIIFYSNGFETYLWDDLFYPERKVSGFYTKEELQYLIERRTTRKDVRQFQVNTDIAGRPYQLEAIKRVAEALVTTKNHQLKGNNREALLVMATGSGKTRTSAAIVDMLTKSNWAKRVLFLADRNALVTQAKNAFKEHLPHLSAIDLTKEEEDHSTRLVFSTYPTIMNRIDELKNEDGRFYGSGHFDVIIIDEAHRSVYQKYGAIFDYFDAILIGLTATPKKDIDHNTYDLFKIDDDNPTFAYELNQAVKDEYLVPPKAINVPVKFVHQGIKYEELSDKDKEKFEATFLDGAEGDDDIQIGKSAINSFLFNEATVDVVLDHLMHNGIKVEGGDKLGKTIIFAKNHKHALFIEERFNKNYPEFSGNFLRVIDNYESKAQDLLENFCEDKIELEPQIAVSVDMMDTGVDAPRVVNLVFFKQVKSYSKYWQMIGRGTRLRPNLFGPGMDKTAFVIFDICDNFSFFNEFPDGLKSTASKTLSAKIFDAHLNVIMAIRDNTESTQEDDHLAEQYTSHLHNIISNLDKNRFEVRKHLALVEAFKNRQRWDNLSQVDVHDISENLSGLEAYNPNDDEGAKRFDLLMLNFQLALLLGATNKQHQYIGKLVSISQGLLKKRTVPNVKAKLPLLKELQEETFWKSANASVLERIRIEIRDLLQFLGKEQLKPVYTDFDDHIERDKVTEVDILPTYARLKSYKDRVETFIRKNKTHLVIDRLHKNIPITQKELELLETFLFNDELGSKEEYEKEYGEQPLGKFVRSIVGLDIKVVNQLFSDFIQDKNLSPVQITFIQTLINYLNTNGTLDKKILTQPPFNEASDDGIIGLFEDNKVKTIVSIIDEVNLNIG